MSAEGLTRPFASPFARKLAKEAGIDLVALTGAGPQGRIIARDVEAARVSGVKFASDAARQETQRAQVAQEAQKAQEAQHRQKSADATRLYFAPGSYEEVPLDSMRKAIARRMTEAAQSIPHFYLTCDCEIDALMALRAKLNAFEQSAPASKISLNDMIVKALALALQEVPDANASYTSDALLRHKSSDIGVAVAIPGGLITPIIRDTQRKSLRAISDEIKALAARAKERKLKPTEYEGGASAVSNLGMYGVKQFTAVINPPQSSILAIGMGERRISPRGQKAAIVTMMTVTLSCDHRVIDGALGAELLAAFKRLIEKPVALTA